MGWASGSRLFSAVIAAIQPEVKSEPKRRKIYASLIKAFRDDDWDTLDECLGEDPAYDAVYDELFPPEDEGDDESVDE